MCPDRARPWPGAGDVRSVLAVTGFAVAPARLSAAGGGLRSVAATVREGVPLARALGGGRTGDIVLDAELGRVAADLTGALAALAAVLDSDAVALNTAAATYRTAESRVGGRAAPTGGSSPARGPAAAGGSVRP
jgi:hypothetical protein